MDGQWYRPGLPPGLGGTGAPRSLTWSLAEVVPGANAAVWMYAGGPSFAHVLWLIGTPGQRRFAELAGGVHDGIRQMFMVIEHARTGCSRCPCRRSAVPGSCRTIPSSSTSGTRRSTACTRAPPPSGAWTCSSKVVRDQGGALRQLLGEITEFAAAESGNGRLKLDRAALARAVAEVEACWPR